MLRWFCRFGCGGVGAAWRILGFRVEFVVLVLDVGRLFGVVVSV